MKYFLSAMVTALVGTVLASHHHKIYSELDLPASRGIRENIVCYYTSTSWTIKESPFYKTSYLNPRGAPFHLCTHVIFAHARVMPDLNFKIGYPERMQSEMIGGKVYSNYDILKILALRKSESLKMMVGLKVNSLSSVDETAEETLYNDTWVDQFAVKAREYVELYQMDGMEFVWSDPSCKNMTICQDETLSTSAFMKIIQRLSMELRPRGLLLTATISWFKDIIEEVYDFEKLNEYLDFYTLVAYNDYDTDELPVQEEVILEPFSARYTNVLKTGLDVGTVVQHLLKEGANATQLVLGMSAFGRLYRSPYNSNFTDLTYGSKTRYDLGPYSFPPYFMATISSICTIDYFRGRSHSRYVFGEEPHLKKETRFLTYGEVDGLRVLTADDLYTARVKANFVRYHGLAGLAFFALDLDDHSDMCGCGKFPYLKAINEEFYRMDFNFENCTSLYDEGEFDAAQASEQYAHHESIEFEIKEENQFLPTQRLATTTPVPVKVTEEHLTSDRMKPNHDHRGDETKDAVGEIFNQDDIDHLEQEEGNGR